MKLIKDLINIENRIAVVTGATGHIGKHIASVIAELGGQLILIDKPGSNYKDVLKIINKFSYKDNICIDCDLESKEDREKLLNEINSNNETIDILINNAAFVGSSDLTGWVEPFESQTIDTWERALNINLSSVFHLSKGLSSLLKSSGKGSIINISSIYGIIGPDYSLYENTNMGNPAAYAASKGGLIQLTKWLATTMAPKVRVNSISPGGLFRNQPETFVNKYIAATPLNRMGKEEDLIGAVAYLSSDMSQYVTGQNLIVDGGKTVK